MALGASKKVLVAGASGLVGYSAMKHFAGLPNCEVVAISRRRPYKLHGAKWLQVDLTNEKEAAAALKDQSGFTHVVYTALLEQSDLVAGWRDDEQMTTNINMLRYLLEPVLESSPGLRHITLLQGGKAYGSHVRAVEIPAREDRSEMRDQPNFYWLQEDYIKERQRGQSWHWTIVRPYNIFGLAIGGAMNIIPVIGTYAAMCKEKGEPLHYPGGQGNINGASDTELLAHAFEWAGEAPTAANQVFNVTNGDLFIWENVWPAIADALGMRPGGPITMSFADTMPARSGEWDQIRSKYNLVSPGLMEFVGSSFQMADYTMRTRPHNIPSNIKVRQAGFHECIDTEAMFRKWFTLFRSERLLPP